MPKKESKNYSSQLNPIFQTTLNVAKAHQNSAFDRFSKERQDFFLTGFDPIDQITCKKGLPYGKAIMVYSDPGLGKSTLLLTLTHSLVTKAKKKVLFIAVEGNDELAVEIGLLGKPEDSRIEPRSFKYLEIGGINDLIEVMNAFFLSSYEVAVLDGIDLLSNILPGEKPNTESFLATGKYDGFQSSVFKWMNSQLRKTRKSLCFSTHTRIRADRNGERTSVEIACASSIKHLAAITCRITYPQSLPLLHKANLQLRSLRIERNAFGPLNISFPFEFLFGKKCTCNELLINELMEKGTLKQQGPWWVVKKSSQPEKKFRGISELLAWLNEGNLNSERQ
jgi:hypothetical protein